MFLKKKNQPKPEEVVLDGEDEELQENSSESEALKQTENAQTEVPNSTTVSSKTYEKYKNIDWRKVSQERVFRVMAEVMLENKRLNQDLDRLTTELEQNYVQNKGKDKSREVLENIAQRIAPGVINEINKGKKFSIIELQDYIVKEVLENKSGYMNRVIELSERVKSHKELFDELQKEYYALLETQNKQTIQDNNGETPTFTEADFKNLTANIPVNKTDREPKVVMKVISLEKAKNLFMQEDSLIIAKVLGEEGISEFPIIQQRVKREGISDNRFETIISNFEKEEIIELVKTTTFQRNTGLRLIKLKEDVGVRLYKEVFKKAPIKPEMQIIREENDNYEHGYSIKDTLNVLKENYGYEQVSMSRKTNTITVADRTTWVPDIIGINPISKKKEYFEIEMGTHNDENFNYKLDKALLVTSELKIITTNKITADRIMSKVKTWYNQKKSSPNMVVKVYTFVEFKRKEEGRFYPNSLEEKPTLFSKIQTGDSKGNKSVTSTSKKILEDEV